MVIWARIHKIWELKWPVSKDSRWSEDYFVLTQCPNSLMKMVLYVLKLLGLTNKITNISIRF